MDLRSLAAVTICAASLVSAGISVAQPAAELSVKVQPTGEDIYEVSIEGRQFRSRDAVEQRLLVETAKLTIQNGKDWFRLLEMPGEGAGTHPLRPVPEYGRKYRKWHPQWAYRLEGERWQRWRPEWGATFWADSADSRKPIAFQASSLVLLGSGPKLQEGDIFEAREVLSDLAPKATSPVRSPR